MPTSARLCRQVGFQGFSDDLGLGESFGLRSLVQANLDVVRQRFTECRSPGLFRCIEPFLGPAVLELVGDGREVPVGHLVHGWLLPMRRVYFGLAAITWMMMTSPV